MSSVSGIGASPGFRFTLQHRHRLWIILGSLAGVALIVVLTIHGAQYYMMPLAQRVKSPQHASLRASGPIGRGLGILGLAMFAIMYLYPLRKRLRFLTAWGNTKNWLDYHVVLGLIGPVLVTFHATFKLNGIAGAAYWVMIAVALSGIVGRYMYSAIPRRLDEAEMSMDEMQQLRRDLSDQLDHQSLISITELQPLFDLPSAEKVQAMPTWRALLVILELDIKRAFLLMKLRRSPRYRHQDHKELVKVLELAKQEASLSKDIVFLSKIKQLFELWHIIHRPFSYSFAVLVVIHVLVVSVLGFSWS